MKSSGLIFTLNQDGSAAIGYEDYDVDCFGGDDYEVMYYLDASNFKLLMKKLSVTSKSKSKMKDVLIAKFGQEFNSIQFEQLCQAENIIYERNVYIG